MDTIEQVIDIETADGPMATPIYRPADGQPRPAIIVIMEVFGVNANIQGIAQRFAAEGYVAVAPDLYHRTGRLRTAPYDNLAEFRDKLRQGFSDDSVVSDVSAAVHHLRGDSNVRGPIGIVGFCLGGKVSYLAAANVRGLTAAAVYYGGFLEGREEDPPGTKKPIEDTSKITVPLIGFFGNDDNNPSPAQVSRIHEELNKHGVGHSFHSYGGAGHGFFCDDRDDYRPGAAADAWRKTLEFFAQHLAGAGS